MCPQWQHIALAQGVQVVGPGLQHSTALLYELGAVVGAAVQVFHAVGQLRLDGGPVEAQAFVQDGAGRGPKAVAGDVFLGAVAHAPQGGVDGVLAHGSVVVAFASEDVGAASGQRVQAPQEIHGLPGQGHQMGRAVQLAGLFPLHAQGGYGPGGGVQIQL